MKVSNSASSAPRPTTATIEDVRAFWEAHPLFTGESGFSAGTREFFEEHRRVVIADGFAGKLDKRLFPKAGNRAAVLDLGCGPGFWTVELGRLGCGTLIAADLTEHALALARRRCEIYGVQAQFSLQNAEQQTFPDSSFSHVNCQGVIHHTPDTNACISEIHRVLRPRGSASLSVYFRNAFLRHWKLLRPAGLVLSRLGGELKGRGRKSILSETDASEIVRLYDGLENPIGKSYSRVEFRRMLEPYFVVEETFLHFFPARALPFRLAPGIHRLLDRHAGFLIHATLRKR